MGIKKIAIVGPESTGKSILSEKLAMHINTVWVPEYAREYLDNLDRPYTREDLPKIAKGQIALEDKLFSKANRALICDTTLLVIKIWSEVKYGYCEKWIIEEVRNRHYDYHLLMNIDLPWVYDPYREHPHRREFLFEKYREELIGLKVPYSVISGNYDERLEKARDIVSGIIDQSDSFLPLKH